MKTKEEIMEILLVNLDEVYCDNCGTPKQYCKDCYRKNIYWSLSKKEAEYLANQILSD